MKMEKRKFRIGELAKLLEVERFVIRFWEKEFSIKKASHCDCHYIFVLIYQK